MLDDGDYLDNDDVFGDDDSYLGWQTRVNQAETKGRAQNNEEVGDRHLIIEVKKLTKIHLCAMSTKIHFLVQGIFIVSV